MSSFETRIFLLDSVLGISSLALINSIEKKLAWGENILPEVVLFFGISYLLGTQYIFWPIIKEFLDADERK